MNPALDTLFARRSIRQYADAAVSAAALHDLLEAAMAAPSACAKDPWHIIVVRQRSVLDAIAAALPNGGMLRQAPVGLVVCGDLDAAHANELSFLLQDCSAAIENILLAAQTLGLGGCWLGVHPRLERVEHLRALLGIPESVVPVSVVAIGHPAESKPARTRYRADAVHHDHW